MKNNLAARVTVRRAAGAAFIVALTALLGSLYYSEVAGFIPCKLCWYQRILMYPLSWITLVALLRRDRAVPLYVLPLALFGGAISIYHYLLQQQIIGQTRPCLVGVPCSVQYVNYFGFVSIPLLALTAFVLIALCMGVLLWSQRDDSLLVAA